MFEILIVVGVALLSFACRTFENPSVRRIGGAGILATSYLIAYFISGSFAIGFLGVAAWFLLPWVEILTRIRRLRLPIDKKLEKKAPPSSYRFPILEEVTEEIEQQGFEYVEDTGWEWEGIKQFFRLFYHPNRRQEAVICFSEQGEISFCYLSVSSRTQDGATWRTWNYPFSYTMKLAPELHMNRTLSSNSFSELLDLHQAFLDANDVSPKHVLTEDPDRIPSEIQKEIRRQIDHNLDAGVIALSGNGTFKYSWRGLFFLWFQFVKDMVRLS